MTQPLGVGLAWLLLGQHLLFEKRLIGQSFVFCSGPQFGIAAEAVAKGCPQRFVTKSAGEGVQRRA
jgi:hypothetical protein